MPEIISPTDRPRRARVSFGVIEDLAGNREPKADIADAFEAGMSIERYGREWHMGRTQEEDGWVLGRIGFQAAGVTELWNPKIQDFEEFALDAGTTAPFAVDTESLRVAFQIRPGLIRPTSFTGALQALLNEAEDDRRWRVRPDVRAVEWPDWIDSIDRVVQLRFTLKRPNPNYRDRPKVRELIEGLEAAAVQLTATADPDDPDGLEVDDDFVQQMIDHASRDYGTWRAVGEKADEPDPLKWRSDEEVLPERTVQADPETKEARPEDLKRQLEDLDGE